MLSEYKNEPCVDFSRQENLNLMREALKIVDSNKGAHYPLIIGGERYNSEKVIKSINPSNYDEVIGTAASAAIEQAEKAIQYAAKTFESWKNVSARERAGYLFKAAAILRRRKFELSAWMVEEAGKNFQEADADTAEAIDFLEYYGRQALELDKGMKVYPYPGETNECIYIPLGVGVVIAPWNFPLAILTGMTSAAVVSGNTVVMKPASNTVVVAAKLMEILEEAGLPKGVVNYLPGSGGLIGDYLVEHPLVRFINFTGSKEIGLRISKLAGEVPPGQKWIKRVVLEMGGKDTIIVDNEACLKDAADGIIISAFGFQGQKCSACSRAVIVEDVYDQMVDMIKERTEKLKIGAARIPGVNVGPVIDEAAYEKIQKYIETGRKEGRLVTGGGTLPEKGYFIQPTVFADVEPDAVVSQEEIFGPVLALIKAKDFDDALKIANNTEYGLTGAVYTKNRTKIEKAKREFHVGNLYFNRKCTGALVGVQPFGGFNMSGTDSKAGGADYLLLFTQAKSITERL
ncbi:MAG TPA: L-glutamate gamma-semialdehyde dehydrogenase [Clostridia bacterium]